MTTTIFQAAKLLSAQRTEVAIQAMSGAANVSHLAAENEVSRKFVYQQKTKARDALEDAFGQTAGNDGVLFCLPVTKVWLRQVALAGFVAIVESRRKEMRGRPVDQAARL